MKTSLQNPLHGSTRRRSHPRSVARTAAGKSRSLAPLLFVLGLSLAALSVLGPLVTGGIDYRVSHIHHNQLLGLDAVSLAVVAPLAIIAGVLPSRRRPEWPLLAIGPAVYVLYMVPQYVVGPDYLMRAGNNERAFPLMLVMFAVAGVAAIAAWNAIDLDRVRTSPRAERLVARVLLPVAAFLVFSRYLPSLADVMSASPESEEYLAGPAFLWTIALFDLGIALPATVAACVGFRRGSSWARKALYSVVAWFALVGIAVAAMAIAMYLRDDPEMTAGGAAMMTAFGAAFAAITVYLTAPMIRSGRRS
jgi:hypothetical protein